MIFPGIEDFGIVPLESMASGTPVIAYNDGGVKDYLIDRYNGFLFDKQSIMSLNDCIDEFELNIYIDGYGDSIINVIHEIEKEDLRFF